MVTLPQHDAGAERVMRAGRLVVTSGVVVGLVSLVVIAATQAQPGDSGPSGSDAGSRPSLRQVPLASAAGDGGGTLVYPSVVAVHLDRSTAAIARAESAFDESRSRTVVGNQMGKARGEMSRALRATRYVIETTPPPPPVGDRAGSSGGAVSGTTFASPPDTSFALFYLQHDLVTHAAGMLSKSATLNGRLISNMRRVAASRDATIEYIHRVAPPPPPVGDRAGASGAAVGSSFDVTMPTVLPLLDDEVQALTGALALNATLPAGVRTALQSLIAVDTRSKATINTYWPPVVGDD